MTTKTELLNHPVIDLHRKICEIESITGNEASVAGALVSYLQQKGFTVEKQLVPSHYSQERFNVLAYYGSKRDTKICLSSHIDVVGVIEPYFVHNRQDRIPSFCLPSVRK